MIEPHADVREFFRERVEAAARGHGLAVTESVEFYLVNLLSQVAVLPAERLLTRPLVELLADALEAQGAERLRRYRQLGDLALVVCGFFHDFLRRRGVSRNYAVELGGRAYSQAGNIAQLTGRTREFALADVFLSLAEDFDSYARLLDDVRETTQLRTPQEIIKLYERWKKTSSPLLAQRLEQAGVFPQRGAKDKTYH